MNQAYELLSDPVKRERYDKTGETEATEDFASAYEYYRSIYEEISAEDIDSFATRYKGSADEEEDLVNFYEEFGGDLTKVLEHIPCSDNDDVTRFKEKFAELIKAGTLKRTQDYVDTKDHIKLLKISADEAKEAEAELEGRKKPAGDMAELEALILKKKNT